MPIIWQLFIVETKNLSYKFAVPTIVFNAKRNSEIIILKRVRLFNIIFYYLTKYWVSDRKIISRCYVVKILHLKFNPWA